MPMLTRVVALSRISSLSAWKRGALTRCLRTNTSGSCSLLRITQATSAGITPTRNMPRQPIIGSSSGVSSAAASTPTCQPRATYDDTRARWRAGQASAASARPMPNSPPRPMPAIVR
ncbi:hypothetical protein D3C85_1418150 [compost metagenome]